MITSVDQYLDPSVLSQLASLYHRDQQPLAAYHARPRLGRTRWWWESAELQRAATAAGHPVHIQSPVLGQDPDRRHSLARLAAARWWVVAQ